MRLFAAAFAACFLLSPAHAADLIPVEAFARLPEVFDEPALSPDGSKYAAVLRVDDELVLAALSTDGSTKPQGIKYADYRPNWYQWADNRYLLVSVSFVARRWSVETIERRLVTFDTETGDVANLIYYGRLRPGDGREVVSQFQDDLISMLPGDPDHVLVGLDKEEFYMPDVYRVDVDGGTPGLVHRRRPGIQNWHADASGTVRLGWGFYTGVRGDKTGKVRIAFRESGDEDFRTIATYETGDPVADGFFFVGFTEIPWEILISDRNEHGRRAVYRYDTRTGRKIGEVFSSDTYDSGAATYVRGTDTLESISFRDERLNWRFYDPLAQQIHASIPGLFPGSQGWVVSTSEDRSKFVLAVETPETPRRYYLVDMQAGTTGLLGSTYPDLEKYSLSESRAVSYRARDGVEIPAVLTLPKGAAGKPVPLIVHPHGGPSARDYLRYDYWVQYFVSRGWGVLQPNFRGSDGFGIRFLRMGHREWGLSMQDDVTDGVVWAIEEGIADPKRICIVGASYGGYAALQGLVKTPDLYRCGVGLNGVYDIAERISDARYFVGFEQLKNFMPSENLDEISPAENASRIAAPVLIAYGTKDQVVNRDQSEAMVSALRGAGKDVSSVKLKDGDHYLSKQKNRVAFFEAMDTFLQKHLGLGPVPDTSAVAAAVAE